MGGVKWKFKNTRNQKNQFQVKKITRMDERNLDGLTCSQNDDGPIVYSFWTEDREDTPPFTVRRCFNTSGQLR
ncbi:hypothetical protein Peur_012773 [Populus x canadensis]